jgi:hypothetical protein
VSKLERRVVVLLQEVALLGERDGRAQASGGDLAADEPAWETSIR